MKTDEKLEIELGRLFKEAREKIGVSQGKVCRILGYSSPQFLSNFERGLCFMPLDKLRRMIEMYGMDGETVVRIMIELQSKYLRTQLLKKSKKKTQNSKIEV